MHGGREDNKVWECLPPLGRRSESLGSLASKMSRPPLPHVTDHMDPEPSVYKGKKCSHAMLIQPKMFRQKSLASVHF